MKKKNRLFVTLLVLLIVTSIAILARTHPDSPSPVYPQLSALAQNSSLTSFTAYSDLQPNKPVVVCFFCPCENCRQTAQKLAALLPHHNPNLIAIFSIGPADATKFVKDTGFPGTPLLDVNSTIAQQYGVTNCPRVFVLSGAKVLYKNANGDRPLTKDEWRYISPYLH